MTRLRLSPISRGQAQSLCAWRYPGEYAMYDMVNATPDDLMAADFHAVCRGDELVGFRSFGIDGRVPGYDYDEQSGWLDTGGGLRPDLMGLGFGEGAIAAGLDYGARLHDPAGFRVTVAAFNERALRVMARLGFRMEATFSSSHGGALFHVLTRRLAGKE